MHDEPVRAFTGNARCPGCRGSATLSRPRLRVQLDTGESTTVTEHAACPYCRDSEPGWQPSLQPPV